MDVKGRVLIINARYGSKEEVCKSLNNGADVSVQDDERGETALMHAITRKEEGKDIAHVIIEHCSKDSDLNVADKRGQTALMKTAINGMTTIALELIKRGADVNMQDEQGETALMKAAYHGLTVVAHELIERGADVNVKDKHGKTALMFVGLADDTNFTGLQAQNLTDILIAADADVNVSDDKGNTALMYNVKYEESVQALIERDKDLVASKNEFGRTALFYALVESISSARNLIEKGADLNLTDNFKVSVLSYFIHDCINNEMPSTKIMDEKLDFLVKNGIERKTIANAIINAVFCKLPLVLIYIDFKKKFLSLLRCAAELSKKRLKDIISKFRKDTIQRLFRKLLDMFKENTDVTIPALLSALETLLELGADLNTSDEKHNTISYYIALLGLEESSETKSAFDDVFHSLEGKGLSINHRNYNDETPLFFMLSNAVNNSKKRPNIQHIVNMCEYILQKDPTIAVHTSKNGESVFNLLMKLSHAGDYQDKYFEGHIFKLAKMFKPHVAKTIVNTVDKERRNSPLHIWAASPPKAKSGEMNMWLGPSEEIFHLLLSYGADPHMQNKEHKTPLHACKTWAAANLLLDAGAKPSAVDSAGLSPLLVAAQNSLFLVNPGCFYPDILPGKAPWFWQVVVEKGFDLWACDKDGDSILSILLRENSSALVDSMIEFACCNHTRMSDIDLVGVLNAICQDVFTQTDRKSDLFRKVFSKCLRRNLDMTAPLRSCCKDITKNHNASTSSNCMEAGVGTTESVYQIAKQLIFYCPASVEFCVDDAEGCPPLQDLLSRPVCTDDIPPVISWKPFSKRYKGMLEEVSRRQSCKIQGPYWYHSKHIGEGGFGHVFAGIHEKNGMEVAIKKINNLLLKQHEHLNEVKAFASIPESNYIVRYFDFFRTNEFSFVILELMEGNLVEYYDTFSNPKQPKMLCKDVALGLEYLHERKIIHRDLKPTNILFRTHPEFRLKIADFGLSRRLDTNSATLTVKTTGIGSRGWIAPEVFKSKSIHKPHSKSTDVFSLGLILHYILSKDHRHPFCPKDCTGKSEMQIILKTETNILDYNMEGWDSCLDTESSHRIEGMLNCTDEKERPTASMLLNHPMFWSKKKKLDFLSAVGNQEEFECPRAKRPAPSLRSDVEKDLENEFATIVKFGMWDDPRYTQTSVIFIEMQKPIVKHDKKGKPYNVPARKYDIVSAVELVRFIRNAIAHVASRTPAIQAQILDAVFLEEFPNLVIEVFKAVTAHGWEVSREEIKHVLAND